MIWRFQHPRCSVPHPIWWSNPNPSHSSIYPSTMAFLFLNGAFHSPRTICVNNTQNKFWLIVPFSRCHPCGTKHILRNISNEKQYWPSGKQNLQLPGSLQWVNGPSTMANGCFARNNLQNYHCSTPLLRLGPRDLSCQEYYIGSSKFEVFDLLYSWLFFLRRYRSFYLKA